MKSVAWIVATNKQWYGNMMGLNRTGYIEESLYQRCPLLIQNVVWWWVCSQISKWDDGFIVLSTIIRFQWESSWYTSGNTFPLSPVVPNFAKWPKEWSQVTSSKSKNLNPTNQLFFFELLKLSCQALKKGTLIHTSMYADTHTCRRTHTHTLITLKDNPHTEKGVLCREGYM